jgi:hypothetical protein
MTTMEMTADEAPPINMLNFLWMGCAFVALAIIIAIDNVWLLHFVHVMAGVLWTGIDLFMGFIVGPLMRKLPFPARRAFILRLAPKTLFLMPTLAILTGTAGWFHARQIGLLATPYPDFYWVVAALVILAVLTIQGLGILLPTNLRVYLELRKPKPDGARVGHLMRWYFYSVTLQGIMQVAIIVVMAKFVTGI